MLHGLIMKQAHIRIQQSQAHTCPILERDEGSELHWILAAANLLPLTGTLTKFPGNPFSAIDFFSTDVDLGLLVLSLVSNIAVVSTFLVD